MPTDQNHGTGGSVASYSRTEDGHLEYTKHSWDTGYRDERTFSEVQTASKYVGNKCSSHLITTETHIKTTLSSILLQKK